ncbi:MAG: nucleotidyltransferase family protein [Gammaproteobacteria bacterium]|nr:nucleotidyltransferase family protein [Gammaproteobacteria bacterium]
MLLQNRMPKPENAVGQKRKLYSSAPGFSRATAVQHHPGAAELFAAIIRGEPPVMDHDVDAKTLDEYRSAAAYHGVGPLVTHALSAAASTDDPASALRDLLHSQTHADAAVDLIRERELIRVLDNLAARRIYPLLIKGTPLGYTHYSSPALRPRGDTDMLIPEKHREPVKRVLKELGYGWDNAVSGKLITYQFTAEKRDRHGVEHALDIHWRLSNLQLFSELFGYDELFEGSLPLGALGNNARTICPIHALILACAHRAGHIQAPYYVGERAYYGGNRLIWLYDIHLLLTRMIGGEVEAFANLAAEKKVTAVCLDGLLRVREHFHTELPAGLVASLSESGGDEPSARYLEPGAFRHFIGEIRALPDWRTRAALVKEHAFPPADFVMRKYHVSSRAWLPALYLHRGLRGAWKLLKRP